MLLGNDCSEMLSCSSLPGFAVLGRFGPGIDWSQPLNLYTGGFSFENNKQNKYKYFLWLEGCLKGDMVLSHTHETFFKNT